MGYDLHKQILGHYSLISDTNLSSSDAHHYNTVIKIKMHQILKTNEVTENMMNDPKVLHAKNKFLL